MEDKSTTLDKVPVGETCIVHDLEMDGVMRRRLQDLGMIDGTSVVPTKKSPRNGPTAYRMRESVYALRQEDACHINVTLP